MNDLFQGCRFHASDKMADLIQADYRYLLLLERFQIPLGFGNRSIGELCKNYDVDENLFLLIVNMLYDPARKISFSAEELKVDSILQFLKRTHTYFIDYQLPRLREMLRMLIVDAEPLHQSLLNDFFDKYEKEVIRHMRFEERQVYPYMLARYQGSYQGKHDMAYFEKYHNDIERKINDLRNIIIKYLPPLVQANAVNELLYALFQSEDDLNRHTFIEEQLLFPAMRYYESKPMADEQ